MPRSLTFGYNAVLCIAELAADRLVGAQYDDLSIPDTFFRSFSILNDEGNIFASGRSHVLISKPHISFDATREGKNAILRIDDIYGIVDFTILPLGANPREEFHAAVEVQFNLIRDSMTNRLRPDFSSTITDDIAVTPDPSLDLIRQQVVRMILPQILVEELGGPTFERYGMSIRLDQQALKSDDLDFVVINDTTMADQDNLCFAFFERDDPLTRGHPDGIPNFLETDKTFSFRLSRAIFDQRIAEFINERFMRFQVTVARTEQVERNVRITPPDESGQVTLEGGQWAQHSGVSGTVRNATTSRSVSFRADAEGRFSVTMEASIGDVLEIHGSSFIDRSQGDPFTVYPPQIQLRDGYIQIGGEAFVDAAIGLDVEYEGRIQLRIDPVTGRVLAHATDVSVDIPWWADILLFLFLPLLYGILLTLYREKVAGQIEDIFNQSNTNFIPGLNEPGRIAVFAEDIAVRANGLVLSGQIEAGRIQNAGRTVQTTFTLDNITLRDWEGPEQAAGPGETQDPPSQQFSQTFGFDTDSRTFRSFYIPATHPLNGTDGIENLGMVNFEQLSIDDLTDPARRYTPSVSLSDDVPIIDRVFAIRTRWNRYAKVRIDQHPNTGEFILRWVTYQAPIDPSVEIIGEWRKSANPTEANIGGITFGTWAGADLYWADLVLEFRRLYQGAPLEIDWQYDGPDLFNVYYFDRRRARLEIDTVQEGDEPLGLFTATIQVEVRDIFGRSALASREFAGASRLWVPSGYIGFDPERLWFLLDPEKLRSFTEIINAFQSKSRRIR
jgi:hypothetical protein